MLSEDIFEANIPDVSNVDIDVSEINSTIPIAGPEVGVSNLIMQAIQDCYSMIESYNSLSIALSDMQEMDMAQDVSDIISTEHLNIGVLQDLLKQVSPNAEVLDQSDEDLLNNFISTDINESLDEPSLKTRIIKEISNLVNSKSVFGRHKEEDNEHYHKIEELLSKLPSGTIMETRLGNSSCAYHKNENGTWDFYEWSDVNGDYMYLRKKKNESASHVAADVAWARVVYDFDPNTKI